MKTISTANDLPLTYRQSEAEAIFRCVRAGDSCSVVGPSGVAKSNLYRFLRQENVRRHYLGEEWQTYLLVHLDANEITELTEEAVSNLLVERLVGAAPVTVKQHSLSGVVKAVFEQEVRAIVFLFDQFDAVYETLNGRFFANLRAIRDEYKYQICFVLLSRNELTALATSPEREEFEELFSSNTIGLGPYNKNDSFLLLQRVGNRYGQKLDAEKSQTLIELTGGHPGMLKAAGIALFKDNLELAKERTALFDALLNVTDVLSECDKLWNSIGSAEQQFLRRLETDSSPPRDKQTKSLLQLKGLINVTDNDVVHVSPLFAEYVSRWKGSEPAATKLAAGAIRIDTAGEVWVNDELVMPALTKKELLLLEYLCLSPGRLRTKDEIIAAAYPEEHRSGAGVSDDALNAVVKRLRDRLEAYSGFGDKIVTVRGKGYRLESP